MNAVNQKPCKPRRSSVTGGVLLIGIGLVFLLSNLYIIPSIGRSWPLILIAVGVALLAGAMTDHRESGSPPSAPKESAP